jgi:hypothetical protein
VKSFLGTEVNNQGIPVSKKLLCSAERFLCSAERFVGDIVASDRLKAKPGTAPTNGSERSSMILNKFTATLNDGVAGTMRPC